MFHLFNQTVRMISLEMNHTMLIHALLVLERCLANQRLVDVWNDTTAGNGSLNQRVEFLISPDSQLQVAWINTLDL